MLDNMNILYYIICQWLFG